MEKKKYPGAKPPATKSLKKLAEAADSCKGCDLYKNATQAVFGSGKANAKIMLIGEQPGSSEDTVGEPFVGAAGGVLRDCLQKAGIALDQVYMTNAVKHFKWVPAESGKRRIHEKPSTAEVAACRPWLNKQIEIIKPKIIVILGATAVKAVLGKTLSITKERGKVIKDSEQAEFIIVSWHPSSILRSIQFGDADEKRKELIQDLKLAARLLKK